jgi:hypothetical protein
VPFCSIVSPCIQKEKERSNSETILEPRGALPEKKTARQSGRKTKKTNEVRTKKVKREFSLSMFPVAVIKKWVFDHPNVDRPDRR